MAGWIRAGEIMSPFFDVRCHIVREAPPAAPPPLIENTRSLDQAELGLAWWSSSGYVDVTQSPADPPCFFFRRQLGASARLLAHGQCQLQTGCNPVLVMATA